MKTSEQIDKLAEALAKAQGMMENPEKNKTATIPTKAGGKYSYNYADLPGMFDSARHALSHNGLSHISTLDILEGRLVLFMRLMHVTGQWIQSFYPLPSDADDKAMAASMTYGRRYLFSALTGIAGEDDTDSDPAEGGRYEDKKPKITLPMANTANTPAQEQRNKLLQRCLDLHPIHRQRFPNGSDFSALIKTRYGKESVKDLDLGSLAAFVSDIEADLTQPLAAPADSF